MQYAYLYMESWRCVFSGYANRLPYHDLQNCEMLEQNKPDFYDSGMVQSGENVSVPYSGPELQYATRYYAKLQVRYDNSDKVLCSAPIKFITEIAPSGWQADWICKPHLEPHNDFTYFRKKAVARQTVKSAVLYVSAHNHFKLWLNQTQLSSYVAPHLPTFSNASII